MNFKIFLLLIINVSSMYALQVKQNTDPLTAYRKGYFRRVLEIFEKNPELTNKLELQYVLGSSYLELRKYDEALNVFRHINAEEFYQNWQQKHLYPFYVQRYLETIVEVGKKNILSPAEEEELIKAVQRVPNKSAARYSIDELLFSVLWSETNYVGMMLFNNNNLTDVGKAWIELAKFENNMPYDLSTIFKAKKSFEKNLAYSNVIQTIDIHKVDDPEKLKMFTELFLLIPEQREKSAEFAKKYSDITQNKEYYVLNQANILAADKKPTDAAIFLYEYINANPEVSKNFYRQAHSRLVNRKLFDMADEISWLAKEQHNTDFYIQLPSGIEYTKNADRALNWYKENYHSLTKETHNQILRSLIRLNMKKAEELADFGYETNLQNSSFILMYGLIKEYFQKREEAYKAYLYLMFEEPFSYDGIVARKKEKKLRSQFPQIFDAAVNKIEEILPDLDLTKKLMVQKSWLLDPVLSNYVNIKDIRNNQKEFNKIVYNDLNTVSKISELDSFDYDLTNFSIETTDIISRHVSQKMENSKSNHDRARYFYKYRNIFVNTEIDGYLTFRLYFYARDLYGFSAFLNLPKDVLDFIFPRPCFDFIKKYSHNDTDLAYWMLSSFMAESHFRKRVYSHVGAVGFAQVMPYTAKDIKRWMKKPEFTNYDFLDNLRMGIYYHYKMYQDMDHNIVWSLAAYNAGPVAVKRWIKQYDNLTKDQYLFIESIPYMETRNYVRSIVYNYNMYRTIYESDANLYPL